MKRFFPLLLGLSLVCFSFSTNLVASSVDEDCAVNSLIKICDYMPHYTSSSYQCDPSSGHLEVDPGTCIGTLQIYVRTTNLASNPVRGVSYSLPTGQEPIFYEYSYGGNTFVVDNINSFKYEDAHNGIPVYE